VGWGGVGKRGVKVRERMTSKNERKGVGVGRGEEEKRGGSVNGIKKGQSKGGEGNWKKEEG